MKFIRGFIEDIRARQNLDIYITVLVTIIVAVLGIIGVANPAQVSAAVLAVLAIVSTSLLHNRRENDQLEKAVKNLDDSIRQLAKSVEDVGRIAWKSATNTPSLLMREDLPDLRRLAKDARTIDTLMWAGHEWLYGYVDMLYEKLQEGCHIRLIVIDPNSEAANVVYENLLHKEIKSDLEKAIGRARGLMRWIKDNSCPGVFEFRLTKWLPPTSLIIINGHQADGIMSVGIYQTYVRTARGLRRYLLLDKRNNSKDYDFYLNQYESLWNE